MIAVKRSILSQVLFLGRCFMALTTLSGCAGISRLAAAEPVDASRSNPMPQVIVKLNNPNLHPGEQEYLNGLARDIGANFVYVRSMSGGAHVLRIKDTVDAAQFRSIVKQLAKRPEVEYAEADRHVSPRQP